MVFGTRVLKYWVLGPSGECRMGLKARMQHGPQSQNVGSLCSCSLWDPQMISKLLLTVQRILSASLTSSPQSTSIEGLMVSIRWYLWGLLKGSWRVLVPVLLSVWNGSIASVFSCPGSLIHHTDGSQRNRLFLEGSGENR